MKASSPTKRHFACLAAALAFGLGGTLPAQSALFEEAVHVMNRIGFGATPSLLATINTPSDLDNWITNQLNATGTQSQALTNAIAAMGPEPAAPNYNAHSWTRTQLQYKRILKAAFHPNQLEQRMANFWRVLFNTRHSRLSFYGEANATGHEWKQYEEFRQFGMTNFRRLLDVSIDNISMRVYLDLFRNLDLRNPNENYTRELFELHTLGPEYAGQANYSDEDIKNAARDLVGLRIAYTAPNVSIQTQLQVPTPPTVTLFATTPNVTALTIPASGDPDVKADALLDHLAGEKQCARYICLRLIREFVTDDETEIQTTPVQRLLASMINRWGTNGDIKAVLTHLFASKVFRSHYRRNKIERPFESEISQLRRLGAAVPTPAQVTATSGNVLQRIHVRLATMGQDLFQFPSPDGYPLSSFSQAGASRAQFRWKAAFDNSGATGTLAPLTDPVAFVTAIGANLNDPYGIVRASLAHLYPNDFTANDGRRALYHLDPATWAAASTATRESRVALAISYISGMTQAFVK